MLILCLSGSCWGEMEDLVGEENADCGLLLAPDFSFSDPHRRGGREGGWSLIFLLGFQRDDQEPCATRREHRFRVGAAHLGQSNLGQSCFFY